MTKLAVRQLQRAPLLPFVARGFEHLHSNERFLFSKHVQAMRHALEDVARGETLRLLITVPPRHGKSICASRPGFSDAILQRRSSSPATAANWRPNTLGTFGRS